MTRLHRGLILIALMAVISLPMFAATRGRAAGSPANPATPTAAAFPPTAKEAYLTDDTLAYIRPGLKVKLNSVAVGTDGKVNVDLSITDDFDQPIDRLGKTTPGAVSISYILAWYSPTTRQYTAYTTRVQTTPATSPHPGVSATQAGTDSGGTTTDLETGHVKYLFKTVLPTGFDGTRTHTLGIYASRNMTDTIGKIYYANVEYDFRPDGNKVTDVWDKVNLATSCNNCHDPLSAHGGARRDPKLCALCHSPQTIDPDTGNTVDFKVMIHKIHQGATLPSVKAGTPYQIIGFGQNVLDFSKVALPPGQDTRNCAFCHVGSDPTKKPAQNDVWLTKPSRDACGSCHDDIDWATGKNHVGGLQKDDSACASCHVPDSGKEFDASIKGGHVLPVASKQLKGITATITKVVNAAPGKKPTVTIAVKNGDGTPVDGSKLTTFAPIMAGPTTSYTKYFRESGIASATNTNVATYDAATGLTSFTFANAIPADQTGTWAFTADIYRNVTLKQNNDKADLTQREAAFNNIVYIPITGTTATPRRTSVILSQCNSCHNALALHGGQRQNTQECAICHNPTNNDVAQRPASEGQPESISFQRLIHRIHKGGELTQDFTVYGNNKSRHNYNDVEYPGDINHCAKCHTSTSYQLPLATGIDSVTTLRDYYSPQGPATAACLGCHDNRDAAAHAFLNTATFPGQPTTPAEACATCHGAGKDWAVDKVHAQ